MQTPQPQRVNSTLARFHEPAYSAIVMHNEPDTTALLTPAEAAAILRVGRTTVYRIIGLEWVEYQGGGERPIRRITRASVERLLRQRKAS